MTDPIVRGSGNVGSRIGRELAGVADFDIREDATEERSTAYLYQIRVDDIVRYIGKGGGRRMYIHVAEAKRTARRCGASTAHLYPLRHRRLVEALRRRATITERIIISGLTDRQALALERTIIALFHSDRTGQRGAPEPAEPPCILLSTVHRHPNGCPIRLRNGSKTASKSLR